MMMDPAEEIVNTWLQQQGFFTRAHVKVGYYGKEIDLLAFDPKKDRGVHVEVHAAVFPLGPLRPWGPARYGRMPVEQRVKLYFQNKFVGVVDKKSLFLKNECIQDRVREIFGTENYDRWLVLGVLDKGDSEEELKRELLKHRVKVFFIKGLLEEINFRGTAKDPTGRFLQLLAAQITDKSKKRLLGKSRKK